MPIQHPDRQSLPQAFGLLGSELVIGQADALTNGIRILNGVEDVIQDFIGIERDRCDQRFEFCGRQLRDNGRIDHRRLNGIIRRRQG
ncbi:MAG: hypothetical protein B7Z55_19170 [Planctomycetales bacterium 12-60-4]|nr:MAG: hypothetical protein B7Z55_19170 [Planctomycetales bacterium 12-60-4]